MQNYSDEQLIIDYLNGDQESLELLIKRYLKPIYSFVCRYINDVQNAEDITQEVFIKIWHNLEKFDQQKKFKTWIFVIAKNTAIDFFKKKKNIPFSMFENRSGKNKLIETLVDLSPLPDEFFYHASLVQTLSRAMKRLSPQYRMVLSLHYNDHFNFREIAESLAEPLNTIKSRHRRALILLKKYLIKSQISF